MGRRVQEVGIAEGDVLRAELDELLHVVEDRLHVKATGPPVVDDRDRAVPASVGAAVGAAHGTHEAAFVTHREPHVALERREELAGRTGHGARGREVLCRRGAFHPGDEQLGVAGRHDVVGDVRAHARVQAEAAHRNLDRRNELAGEAGGGVHGDRARDPVRPRRGGLVPWVDGQIEGPYLVAPVAQEPSGGGEAQRLVTELVGGDEEDADAAEATRRATLTLVSTRMLLVLAAVTGVAILAAGAIQILLAR